MSETLRHTPGPWETVMHGDRTYSVVEVATGRPICATVYQPHRERPHTDACDNARLIALAPEMYRALQAIAYDIRGADLSMAAAQWMRDRALAVIDPITDEQTAAATTDSSEWRKGN